MQLDPLIPRNILWADPQKHLAKISPDGKYIIFLAPHKQNLNLWLAPIEAISEAKPLSESEHPLRDIWWSKNSRHILYVHDKNGDENWQLCGYDLVQHKTHVYTEAGLQVRSLHSSEKHPDKLLIGLNKRDKHYIDVYELDLITGALKCVYINKEYWDFIANDELQIKIGVKISPQGADYIKFEDNSLITHTDMHDVYGLYFYPRLRLGNTDGEQFYLCQTLKTNTSCLVHVNILSGQTETLFNDPLSDIADILTCPQTKKPLACATYYERKQWHPIEQEVEEDFRFLASIDNGDIDILSKTRNNEIWLVNFVHDDGPVTYYLYYREKQTAVFLFESHDALKKYPLTKMHPRVIKARDGLKCVSYLSLPRQSDIDAKGVPLEPVPLVLMVHGGPSYRDFWGFNPTHQWLANRGYAVLSVNYRASTGFGKEHVFKGFGEWTGKIRTDLLDAVNWAIENKITTPDKVAIMGRSFGGYSTLVGLTFTPEVYCCGVDIVGPSNLETMIKNFPPYWKTVRQAILAMIGLDPDSEEGKVKLRAESPLYLAHKIKKPLLIGHGANDVRVLQSESDEMVKAMQQNKIPVTYAIFEDEGHQFMHPGNRMAFYALTELFLAQILKGQAQAYDSQVKTAMTLKLDDFNLLPPSERLP